MGQQTVKASDKQLAHILGFLTLGICVLFDVLVGSKTLLQTLLLLTICTAGVGIIVIYGVVFLIGTAELVILERIFGFDTMKNTHSIPLTDHSVNPAVLQYLLEAKKRSLSKEKIIENLIHAGWDPKIIEQAFSVENTHGKG